MRGVQVRSIQSTRQEANTHTAEPRVEEPHVDRFGPQPQVWCPPHEGHDTMLPLLGPHCEEGYTIRTIRDLLGDQNVKTTMNSIHVLSGGEKGVHSPTDCPWAGPTVRRLSAVRLHDAAGDPWLPGEQYKSPAWHRGYKGVESCGSAGAMEPSNRRL
jgi:hypothetical protein